MLSTSSRRYVACCAVLLLLNTFAGCALTAGNPPTGGPPTPFAFPTNTPPPEWQVYHDPQFGFSLEVPGVLSQLLQGGNASGTNITYQYDVTNGTPSAGVGVAAEMTIQISATTAGPNACTIGTPTTIGQGATAYVQIDLSGKLEGGNPFRVAARILSGGVFIEIQVAGQVKPADFMARYGAIWQHILDSFVPGPPVLNTHPCD